MAQCAAGDPGPGSCRPRHRRERGGRRPRRKDRLSPVRSATCRRVSAAEIVDCEGRWITPGLIDCHTHLVHAGNRANEFEMRLAGATYEEVARAGGGIVSSVKALRAASEDELVRAVAAAARRADRRRRHHDRDQVGLRPRPRQRAQIAARRAPPGRRAAGHASRTTFLGAHALPPEAKGDKDAYHRPRRRRDAAGALPRKAWPTRSTGSAKASPFRPSRSRASSRRPRRSACRSSCMPTSFPTCTAPRLPRASARCRPIISNIPTRRARGDGEGRHGRRDPARRLLFHPRDARSRRSTCSAGTACRWRSPPTAIPAPRR